MKIQPNTHLEISPALWGTPTKLGEGRATVQISLQKEMATDDYGLIHGGTIFGVADYAAMLAVNHPYVVLSGAKVKFLSPSRVSDVLVARAKINRKEDRKIIVVVEITSENKIVFKGEFVCIIPDKHVLENKE